MTTPANTRVYLGTGCENGSKGIYLASLDLRTGQLSEPQLVAEVARPGFLALHPQRPLLYSVGRSQAAPGLVYSFEIDESSGKLTLLNMQPSGGSGPCHIAVDPDGQCVLTANYGSGSVAVLPIVPNGELAQPSCVIEHSGSSLHPSRQTSPHAHCIQVHRSGRFAFAADLGLDRLQTYSYESASGKLELIDAASFRARPAAGPRHIAFHPSLETLYVANELDSTVLALRFDADAPRLEEMQVVTSLPDDFAGDNAPSEIAVHPSGRFLYLANRGHDSLAIHRIDAETGLLEPAGHVSIEGKFPRHFAIDPTGRYLIAAHQKSDNLSVFAINLATGRPCFTGQHVSLGAPMCVLFMPPVA